MSTFHNITGSTGITVELISPIEDNGGIKSILLTNVHATADATVTLFIQDDPASGATSTYNLIHTIAIPADTSLLLDNSSMFIFDDFYGLYITVGASDTVDVIIST
tara:strand:- start:396 stop:713 length:318 start_codon:yes stop_codon:yes gene_type:complete